jgi:hypothetical protein
MIDLASPLQSLGIDEQIGQGVEPFHRVLIAHAWALCWLLRISIRKIEGLCQ